MSHLSLNKLSKAINLLENIRMFQFVLTEGAQIKFKLKGKIFKRI